MDHTESKTASSVAERIPGETVNSASMFFTAGIDDELGVPVVIIQENYYQK